MSNLNFPTIDEVVKNIMKDVLRERVEQSANQDMVPAEEVREETEEVEVEVVEARVFFTEKGAKVFRKTLTRKGFVEERGFKELVPPFKEEVERKGWELLCKHLEQGKRALVKEFYANLGKRWNLMCYVRGRWVPYGERAISQLFGLREGGDCTKYENLQKNPT